MANDTEYFPYDVLPPTYFFGAVSTSLVKHLFRSFAHFNL